MKKTLNWYRSTWFVGKGAGQTRKGDFEKALYYYERAFKYDPHEIPVFVLESMARILCHYEKYEDSKFYAQEYLRRCSEYPKDGEPTPEEKKKVEDILEAIAQKEKCEECGIKKYH